MQNGPLSGGNNPLPIDSDVTKKTADDVLAKENEKSEEEKEQNTIPEDKEPFDVDKVDELEKSKKGEKED